MLETLNREKSREMVSVDEAAGILSENLPPLRTREKALAECHLHTVAREIRAPEPSPRYTGSAMDGFAIRWRDVRGTTTRDPVSLSIVGESRAGIPFNGAVGAGEAVRISTGAMLPEGADTVVRMEDTEENGGVVRIFAVRSQGQDVRFIGEEFQPGEILIARGTRLTAREMALLTSVGIAEVTVCDPPSVSILVTGTELSGADRNDISHYQIRDSNSVMLHRAVRETGARTCSSYRVPDDLEATAQTIGSAFKDGADLILCSGGVSVGRHDHVKEAARRAGFRKLFWKVRQKPGKPLFAARKEKTLLLGLPGNPVSAYICFIHYVRPLIMGLSGRPMERSWIAAKSRERIVNRGQRTNFLRVKIERRPGEIPELCGVPKQKSHMLGSIVNADGYVILQPGESLEPECPVQVILF